MKNIFSLILLLFFVSKTNSQAIVTNLSHPYLKVGIPNCLRIMAKYVDDDKLTVTASVGKIEKVSKGIYYWTYCGIDRKNVWIKIFNGKKLIDSSRYILERIKDPVLATGFSGDSLYKNSGAVGVRGDISEYVGEGYPICKILKFDVEITKSNGTKIQFTNVGAYYTKEFIANYEKLQIGDNVVLKNFVANVVCEEEPRKLSQIFTYFYSGTIDTPRW